MLGTFLSLFLPMGIIFACCNLFLGTHDFVKDALYINVNGSAMVLKDAFARYMHLYYQAHIIVLVGENYFWDLFLGKFLASLGPILAK